MSAPIVIPFNFRPVSVDDKSGSYTVPAGQYAWVTFIAGNCTYDSKNVYTSNTSSHVGLTSSKIINIPILSPFDHVSVSRTSGSGTFDVVAAELNFGAANAKETSVTTGVTTFTYLGSRFQEVSFIYTSATYTPSHPCPVQAYIKGNSATSLNVDIAISRASPTPIQMRAPAGTVLDGSLFHVELFNDIT